MRKITDQVRAEAEQWSQMQDMLGQVRNEMEELQSCRDFWQNRSFESDSQIQNLYSSVRLNSSRTKPPGIKKNKR